VPSAGARFAQSQSFLRMVAGWPICRMNRVRNKSMLPSSRVGWRRQVASLVEYGDSCIVEPRWQGTLLCEHRKLSLDRGRKRSIGSVAVRHSTGVGDELVCARSVVSSQSGREEPSFLSRLATGQRFGHCRNKFHVRTQEINAGIRCELNSATLWNRII
jgi:hypothetical protein